MTQCSVSWCDREAAAKGMCFRCYRRAQDGIDPNLPPLGQHSIEVRDRYKWEIIGRRRGGEKISDLAEAYGVAESTLGRWLSKWDVHPDPDTRITHGTTSAWRWWKCECDICTAAKSEYRHQEYLQKMEHPHVTSEHGTILAYDQGCRCNLCLEVYRTARRQRNDRTRKHATRHGSRWTGAEAEIAFRTDITIEERAELIGRTFAAVDNFIRSYNRRPDDPFGVKAQK